MMVIYLRITSFLLLAGIFFSNALLQTAVLLMLPMAFFLAYKKVKDKSMSTIEILILLLFLSSLLSIYISPKPLTASKNIIYHSILLTIIPIRWLLIEDKKFSFKLYIQLISLFAFFTALAGFFRFLNGADRAFGFFGGYYNLATTLAFTIPITIAYISCSANRWKFFNIFSSTLQCLALWLTYTRSALLGLIMASLISSYFLFKRIKISESLKNKIKLTAVLAAALGAVLLFTSSDTRLNPILIFSNPDLSSGRSEVIEQAAQVVSNDLKSSWQNLVFGHGLESRIILFPKSLYTSWESDYLETLISQGLLGLLIIVLIYYQFFNEFIKSLKKVQKEYLKFFTGLFASGITFWVISFFTSQLVGKVSSAHFVVIYSAMILVNKIQEQKQINA